MVESVQIVRFIFMHMFSLKRIFVLISVQNRDFMNFALSEAVPTTQRLEEFEFYVKSIIDVATLRARREYFL